MKNIPNDTGWLNRSLIAGGLLLAVLAGVAVDRAYSADSTPEKVTLIEENGGFHLVAKDAEIAEIARVLREKSGIDFSIDAESGAEKVTLEMITGSIEGLIRAVAENYALTYEQTEDGPKLTSARLTASEDELPVPALGPRAKMGDDVTENVAVASSVAPPRPDVSTDERTPAALGLLSNSSRTVAELRSRAGPPAIIMASAILDTEAATQEGRPLAIPERFRAKADTEYRIIQFDHELSTELRNRIEAQGAKVAHYVPKNAYAVKLPASKRDAVLSIPGVLHEEPYHPYFKMSVDILKYLGGVPDAQSAKRAERGVYNVMMFNGVDGEAALAGLDVRILTKQSSRDREVLTVVADPSLMEQLVFNEEVQWLEPSSARVPMNDVGQGTIRSGVFQQLHPGFDGSGVIVGVTDSGLDMTHPGFFVDPAAPPTTNNTRVIAYEARIGGPTSDGIVGDTDGHGTHVTGSILGNGALSDTAVKVPGTKNSVAPFGPFEFKGVAPGAKLVVIEDFNSFTDAEQAEKTWDNGARMSNNSWGNTFFQYGTLSAVWDALVRDSKPLVFGNQELIAFFAAGNSGGGANDGISGTAGTVGEPGNAKNVISVGAVEQARMADNLPGGFDLLAENDTPWQVAGFSSRGPVTATDGRVKPDIVAPGTYVISAQSRGLAVSVDDFSDPTVFERDLRNNNVDTGPNYSFLSGTSMATPITTGAGALIYQHLTQNLGITPSPALMKAILVAGGRNLNPFAYQFTPLGNEPAIVHQGWGRLDVVRSVDGPRIQNTDRVIYLDQNPVNSVETGDTFSFPLTVNPGQGGIKIALAWTDPAGTPGTGIQLVNDIDLALRSSSGKGYLGNFFATDGLHSEPFDTINFNFGDELNNVEIIVVPDLAPGNYTIEVFGFAVPVGPQDFALAIHVGQAFVGPNFGSEPSMVLDNKDGPVVAYEALDAGGFRQIFLKRWRGEVPLDTDPLGIWKRMENQWFGVAGSTSGTGVSRTINPSRNPSVAVKDQNIFVAWEQVTTQTGTPTSVYFRQYNGTDWIELGDSARDKGITGTQGFNALRPAVAVAGDGRPVVAWQQNTVSGGVIGLKKWTGSAWVGLGPSAVTGIPGSVTSGRPDIAVDSQGRIVVVWEEYSASRVRVRRWNGSAWEAFSDVGYAFNAQQPDVAIGPDDTIYVAYQQGPDFTQGQLYSQALVARSVGFGWGNVGFFSGSYVYPGLSGSTSTTTTPINPTIGVNAAGKIIVSWQQTVFTNNAVIVKEYNGSSFVGVAGAGNFPGVATLGGLSQSPIVKVDSLGVPVVVFQNNQNGPEEFLSYTLTRDRKAPEFSGLSTATGGSNGDVTLNWPAAFDPSQPITYQIYRGSTTFPCGTTPNCTAANVFAGAPIATTTATSFQVTGLVNGQVYCFGVRATDSTGLQELNTVVRSAGPVSGAGDLDLDCLDNPLEQAAGTDVCIPDTDGDGMLDGWEWTFSTNNPAFPMNTLGMDPLDNGVDKVNTIAVNDGDPIQGANEDLDGDGASNFEEFEWWQLNTGGNCDIANTSPDPTKMDTDGDSIPDGWEIFNGLDPTNPLDGALDPDMDGLVNSNEFTEGGDPGNKDSDGDGIDDGDEFNTFGTAVSSADTDGDGLDDGFETQTVGSNPVDWDSNGSGLSDGDAYQLGFNDPSAVFQNFNFIQCWDFETPASQAGWAHLAPNPSAPKDLWHLSTADPDPKQSGDGALVVDERTVTTAFRVANDPSTTNAAATYNFNNQQIINQLKSPAFDATTVGNLFVEWNEFVDTEQDQDVTRVFGIAQGDILPTPVSTSVSGNIGKWVHRVADMSAFVGRTDVQIVFVFQTPSGVDQNFKGWWVDDVCVYETVTLSGWVRDTDGRPVDDAVVIAIGRGGVTNVVNGHKLVKPGKIFGIAETAEDGSYFIPGLARGQYYVKADGPVHRAEFWNGMLMASTDYIFGSHLNPGVPARELVGAGGIMDLTASAAAGSANFELERGSGRACLGVTAAGVYPVSVNGEAISVWNGQNTPATGALTPYLTDPSGTLANLMPDWLTNAVAPNLMCDLTAGPYIPYAQGLGVLYPAPQVSVREGEVTRIGLTTNQAVGRLFVEAGDGGSYPVVVDGQPTGFNTPANIPISSGAHAVRLDPPGFTQFVGRKTAEVPIGNRVRVTFSTNDLFGTVGDLEVTAVDIFGTELTGAVVYVDNIAITTNEVIAGGSATTPATVTGLLPGLHTVRIELDGYRSTAFRAVTAGSGAVVPVSFTLLQADRDYDRVGDRAEVVGYGDIFQFHRDDDPDIDGLTNLREFEQFAAHGITLNIFSNDTDGDMMFDGAELAFDGVPEYLAFSELYRNASAQTPVVQITFKGRYLDGIDFFENGHYVAAIDCDRFDALALTHTTLAVPTETNSATILTGIPAAIEALRVNPSHSDIALIYSDTLPDRVDTDGDGMWDGFENMFDSSFTNVAGVSAHLDPITCGRELEDPDGDGLNNRLEFLGADGIANTNDFLDPTDFDTDDDGMPDGFEIEFGFDPRNPADGVLDFDHDGLTNEEEFILGTDPLLVDTDGDFLPDGAEIDFGSDPNDIDTDEDGLIDGREVWDRDLDGVFDGGFFNVLPGSDFDNDGLFDGPADFDSDGDGMPDGFEVLDPSFGLPYGPPPPGCSLNPLNANDADLDCDGDGLTNLEEYLVRDALIGTPPLFFDPTLDINDATWLYSTNPFNPDTDGDGMPDGWEVFRGLHPQDPVPNTVNTNRTTRLSIATPGADPDGDGLWNLREFRVRFVLSTNAEPFLADDLSTHPWIRDWDEDGLEDGEEDRFFRTNPTSQDTDGDFIMDGINVPDTYGETDSAIRPDPSFPTPSNTFELATNDLWRLDWGINQFNLPLWTKVEPANPPDIPPGRFASSSYYVPINETAAQSDGTGTSILMDNRSFVVFAGREGVTKYHDIWQYFIPENEWLLLSGSGNTNLMDSGSYTTINQGGLSEMSTIMHLVQRNTKLGTGCPDRPAVGNGNFEWLYTFGGWSSSNYVYFGSEFDSFFKPSDSRVAVVDQFPSDASVWEGVRVTTLSNNTQTNVTSTLIIADDVQLPGLAVLPVGSGFQIVGAPVTTTNGTVVTTSQSIDTWTAAGMHFAFPTNVSFEGICLIVSEFELLWDIEVAPANDLELNLVLEVGAVSGDSPPAYDFADGTSPLDRLGANYFNTSVHTETIPAGRTGLYRIDMQTQFTELQQVFSGTNFGVVVTSSSAEFAHLNKDNIRAEIAFLPNYRVVPGSTHLQPQWVSPETLTVTGGTFEDLIRKSTQMAYDYTHSIAVQFGGMNGNFILDDTIQGTFTFRPPNQNSTPRNVTWQRFNNLASRPEARYAHSFVYDATRDQFVLFGGFNALHQPLNDTWIYTHNNQQWTEITDFMDTQLPQPRGGASMVYFGDFQFNKGSYSVFNDQERIVLFGGTDNDVYFNDTWVLDFVPDSESNAILETTNTVRWILASPNGEHGNGPSPRAFAEMQYAQNAVRVSTTDNPAIAAAYLFGGRTGTLPTGRDTDDDKVEDGIEFALGGPDAGRDPRVNAMVTTDPSSTETIPYAYKRFGTPATGFPFPRGIISSMEALSYTERRHALAFGLPFQGHPVETDVQAFQIIARVGVDAWIPQYTNQWWHRFGGEQQADPRDVWELGVPDNSIIGSPAAPPYAYRGRWVYGTDLNGTYPNNAIMELYSPNFDLLIPSVDSTVDTLSTSYYLSFWEWLDLADANDVVKVDLVKPITDSDTLTRRHGDVDPPAVVLGNRNNVFNTAGEWRQQIIPLDILGSDNNVYLRFTLVTDSSGVAGGWYIDDVSLFQAAQITGTLTNDMGNPMPGIPINLLGTNFNQTVIASTVTDQNGGYQFGPLPFGNYQVGLGGDIVDVGLSPTNANVDASGSITVFITGTSVTLNGELTWPSVPGLNYVIEFTDDMSLPGVWTPLATVTASSVFTTYVDPTSTGAFRFYRVRLLLP